MVRAEVTEYLETFIRNDSKGLAALSKTNMSSWNLTLMQGFTNNVIKNVIIVVLPYIILTTASEMNRRRGMFLGTHLHQLMPPGIMMSIMPCNIMKCQALLID